MDMLIAEPEIKPRDARHASKRYV